MAYDAYIKDEVISQERALYIDYNQHHHVYFGKIAEYATCELNGSTYMLSPYGYHYMAYEEVEIISLTSVLPDEYTHFAEQPIRRREYIQVGDDWYCFKGIDVNRQIAIRNLS